jgi:hypothetical protein
MIYEHQRSDSLVLFSYFRYIVWIDDTLKNIRKVNADYE